MRRRHGNDGHALTPGGILSREQRAALLRVRTSTPTADQRRRCAECRRLWRGTRYDVCGWCREGPLA